MRGVTDWLPKPTLGMWPGNPGARQGVAKASHIHRGFQYILEGWLYHSWARLSQTLVVHGGFGCDCPERLF